jgi:hypothetical protein
LGDLNMSWLAQSPDFKCYWKYMVIY